MSDPAVTGFLLVDKPSGWTSHDVVAKVRKLTRQRKVGHAGTLDPMATGLLVLGLGRATRLLRFVQAAPKEYVATARFGVATDSLDADGAVLACEPMPVGAEEVAAVVPRFVGTIHQMPPMVSARKVEGRRLYELARDGIEVEREARPVSIYDLEILEFSPAAYPDVTFRVRCSSGTYVRTLADDMARALGGRAHLTALRRTANGSLHVGSASTIETLEQLAAGETLGDSVLPPAAGLPDLAAVRLDATMCPAISNGVAVPAAALGLEDPAEGSLRLLDDRGALLAVYRVDGRMLRPDVVLS